MFHSAPLYPVNPAVFRGICPKRSHHKRRALCDSVGRALLALLADPCDASERRAKQAPSPRGPYLRELGNQRLP